MQHSDAEKKQSSESEPAGQSLAVTAESLFLVNLLLLPGVAFLILLVLYLRNKKHGALLAQCHLRQTVYGSIWAGVMLIIVNGIILLLGGYHSPFTWMIVIIYFITIHASLIYLGTYGLARAMNGKHYHYPLIGAACPG